MKKLITLSALLVCGIAANAQRMIDLDVTMVQPTAAVTVHNGQPFQISLIVKNIGADSIKVADTIEFRYQIDGSFLPDIYMLPSHSTLRTNDTLQLNMPASFSYQASSNGSHDFCVSVVSFNDGADSSMEMDYTNNTACATMNFDGGTPEGVNTIAANSAAVVVYPNPAQGIANFKVNLASAEDVSVKILDITGRTVLAYNAGKMNAGENVLKLNIADLPSGIYAYQVIAGTTSTLGKLNVLK